MLLCGKAGGLELERRMESANHMWVWKVSCAQAFRASLACLLLLQVSLQQGHVYGTHRGDGVFGEEGRGMEGVSVSVACFFGLGAN